MINWKRKLEGEDSDESQQIITLSTSGLLSNTAPVGNKLYLYEDITRSSILTLSKQIDEVTRQLKMIELVYNLPSSPAIELHVSTDGGEVNPALSLIDKIKTNPIPIHTYVEGMCASAGSLISVVGKKRFITKNSNILVHQIRGGAVGTYESISDEKDNLDFYMEILKKIYLEHTRFKSKQLTELLKHDLCLSAEQCKEFGLVDEII
jgi:ATP-dependent Clp protease protease subunit